MNRRVMSRAATVSAAQLQRALRAFESHGRPIRSARLYPDGAVLLLSDNSPEAAFSESEPGSWIELVGSDPIGPKVAGHA